MWDLIIGVIAAGVVPAVRLNGANGASPLVGSHRLNPWRTTASP